MKLSSVILALSLIVIAMLLPCERKESYNPVQPNYGAQALAELKGHKVNVPKNSIARVVFTKVRMEPKKKDFGENIRSLFNPKETVRFYGRPKYISNRANTVIVGKSIKFETIGKSIAEAKNNANKRAADIINDIQNVLQREGLMG